MTISIILVVGSAANAANPCCCFNSKEQDNKHLDMTNMDMPCHDNASKNLDNEQNQCSNCDCQHCVKITFLNSKNTISNFNYLNLVFYEKDSLNTDIYYSLKEPPKHTS